MRFVPIKDVSQLDMQALHRARDRLVAERTALINQLRALLLERGIVLPRRRRALLDWVDAPIVERETDPLSPGLRLLVADMRAEWAELDRRIGMFDDEFAAAARSDEATRRVATIPGIGPINATALVAAVGDASAFARARDMSAWLGLSRDKRLPAAGRSCSGSPSAGAVTCARTSSMARAPSCPSSR